MTTVQQEKEEETGRFRFQNQKGFYTYKTHIDKGKVKEFFKQLTKKKGVKYIEVAHEVGKEGTHDHTHVLVDFGYRFDTISARKFDIDNIHPHIEKVLSHEHWLNCVKYLTKEDKENANLVKQLPLITKLWGQSSLEGAFMYATKPGDFSGIKAAMDSKPQAQCEVTPPWCPWQFSSLKMVSGKPHARRIIWICDYKGNTGKSTLAKYLIVTDPNKYLCVTDAGSSSNLATIVKNQRSAGWNGHCFILDIPRDAEHMSGMYRALEKIKNGHITAQKYQGGPVLFDIPHVMVFANFMPNLVEAKWSLDRYVDSVYEIDQDTKRLKLVGEGGVSVEVEDDDVIFGDQALRSSDSSGGTVTLEKERRMDEMRQEIEALKQQGIERAKAQDEELQRCKDELVEADSVIVRLRKERDEWRLTSQEKSSEVRRLRDEVDRLTPKRQGTRVDPLRGSSTVYMNYRESDGYRALKKGGGKE